jgi:hypothetical protein
MTVARSIEHQITRELLQRRAQNDDQHSVVQQPDAFELSSEKAATNRWTDRLIAILAVTAGLVIVGSYAEELLWAVVAATTVLTLR